MSPAARLQVRAFNFHRAENAFAFDLFPHAAFRQFLSGSITHRNRTILKNGFVRRSLRPLQCFQGRLSATQINRAKLGPQMERHRRQSIAFLKHCRE